MCVAVKRQVFAPMLVTLAVTLEKAVPSAQFTLTAVPGTQAAWKNRPVIVRDEPSATAYVGTSMPRNCGGPGLTTETTKLFKEGLDQEHRSNRYTLVEVLIASALFLYGIASVTRRVSIKLGFLGVGFVLFALSCVQIARVRWG